MIRVGDVVTLKDEIWEEDPKACRQSTVVHALIPGIKGGVVLAECLLGFQSWNAADLKKLGKKLGNSFPHPLKTSS